MHGMHIQDVLLIGALVYTTRYVWMVDRRLRRLVARVKARRIV